MIQKKICMLGSFAVGKTSLVRNFVEGIFSDKYLTTIGVKIDKKLVDVNGEKVNLILWDIAGEDEFSKIQASYLRGTSGYFLVVDKTRKNTLDVALQIDDKARQILGEVPRILLVNKWDLSGKWDLDDVAVSELSRNGRIVINTSAKTGLNVDTAFQKLAQLVMEAHEHLAD
jgi:small GTP-binding protein